ncbi:Na(+)/H(+) exchange regulatory cofactor NHE-RF3 [Chanos chanos]|uniref:Na(+)/H(+) exchange regulatory cofactor NHE-RF3 n=1 Tax=Chanos chanos TaxID=29144 RepID=A0A6J2WDA5_CHACN|nr:Na(+)/H(+) exchange regulatory cofactor NHE-RF3 [Chanos chanos]
MAWTTSRVIYLTKREGRSFGFFLRAEHGEEGHLVRSLEMGGPAELAGMKDGDRIIRVNGTFVDNLEHGQVADMVKRSGMSVTFHILRADAYKQAKANGVDLSQPNSHPGHTKPTLNGVSGPVPKPKLCYLERTSGGFGFSVKSSKNEQGIFMVDVIPSGVADKAGVRLRDRLLEINGENVENATHDQVVQKIKESGNSIMFLLVDEDSDRYYKNKHTRLGVGMATVRHLPLKPRIANMTKGSDGYGYMLRQEPNLKGHYVREIEEGSPADKAGLKDMDRIVAVDGEDADGCTHEQVVAKIRQSGNNCCLLVVDSKTDKMYKQGGASPLLFWEEMKGSLPQSATPEPDLRPPLYPTLNLEDYKPKLCRLEKTSAGFGFHLNGIQGVHGQYIKEVVRGGAADQAGLEDDDMVIEVDGVNVENSTHEEVVSLIRRSGDTLVLLVAGRRAYDYFKAKGIPITTLLLSKDLSQEHSEPALLEQLHEEERREEQREEYVEEITRPDTPPSPARERVISTSSSSSSSSAASVESLDERL